MAHILVVEDHPTNMALVTEILEEEGFHVLQATDGAAAMSVAFTELPDLILMDVSLPLVDGLQATVSLKREERTRSIPIIALTAHAMQGDRQWCLSSGCDDYDTKPINNPRLLGKINALLQARSEDFVRRIENHRSVRAASRVPSREQQLLMEQLAELQHERATLHERMERSRASLEAATAEIERERSRFAAIHSTLEQARARSSELEVVVRRGEVEIETLRKQASDAAEQAARQADTLSSLWAQWDPVEAQPAEEEASAGALAAITAERDLLASQVAQAGELQSALDDARRDAAALEAEITRLRAAAAGDQAGAGSPAPAAEDHIADLRRQLELAGERAREAEQRLRGVEEHSWSLQSDLLLLRAELDRVRQRGARAQTALINLQMAARQAIDLSFREVLHVPEPLTTPNST